MDNFKLSLVKYFNLFSLIFILALYMYTNIDIFIYADNIFKSDITGFEYSSMFLLNKLNAKRHKSTYINLLDKFIEENNLKPVYLYNNLHI